jgi:hypothetical protein
MKTKNQTIINIFLIAFFVFLFAVVFPQKKYQIQSDIKEGELLGGSDPNTLDGPIIENKVNDNLSVEILNERGQGTGVVMSDYAEIYFFTELGSETIPNTFIAKKTDTKDNATIFVFSSATIPTPPIRKTPNVPTQTKPQPRNTVANNESKVTTNSSSDEKPQARPLTYGMLNHIVSESKLTYFYPFNFRNFDDVSVGVLSITPYEDSQIIKFQIDNNTSRFFFIANFSIEIDDRVVATQKFFENTVAQKSKRSGIVLIAKQKEGTKLKFILLESSGHKRRYEIVIQVP